MKVSLNWLRRHVDLPESAEEVSKALTSIGLEVEGMEEPAKQYEKLVVAKVLTCEAHPDSDHLHVTTVDDGKETIQVVCGAPNVAAGQTVVLAPIGAELPLPDGKSLKMKKSKIRGVESFGMICAEDEIGLSDDHGGILVLDDKIPAGTQFISLGFYDATYELNVTPNRPDALSHRGVARELAAKFDRPLKPLAYTLTEDASREASSEIKLTVEPGSGCSRYVGRVIENVKVAPSPAWLSRLLKSVGMNSVNNVVDVTNFILMDVGQPLHSFDMAKLNGAEVVVRKAKPGEKIETLDHKEHELTTNDLVICDGDRPSCVAGVMGGVESEITDTTTQVFLESAWFNPTVVRKQAHRLCTSTDSSYRFERGIDYTMQREADDYACALIQEVAGGNVLKGTVEYTGEDHQKEPFVVTLRASRVTKVLGITLSEEEITKYLTGIGLKHLGNMTFEIPPYRPDLEREVDLIEEVARLVGFDNIPYDVPSFKIKPNDLPAEEVLGRRIRYTLSSMGLHECISLRFTSAANTQAVFGEPNDADPRSKPAKLLNPLSEDLGCVPTSLIPILLKSVADNEKNRPGSVRLFENSKAQFQNAERKDDRDPGFTEKPILCAVIAGHWKMEALDDKPRDVEFGDIKGLAISLFKRLGLAVEVRSVEQKEKFLHPGKQAVIMSGSTVFGSIGMVHPAVLKAFDISYATALFEVDLEKVLKAQEKKVVFKPFSRQVFTTRDISMIVAERMTNEAILEKLNSFKVKNLVKVELKSVYQGVGILPGQKNMVYSFTYQSMTETLTDEVVNKAHDKLREKLSADSEITLR